MDSTKTLTLKSITDHHSSSKDQSPRNHFPSHVLMDKVSPTRPVVSLVNLCTLMHTMSRILRKLMKMETLSDKSLLGKHNKPF